MEPEIRAFIPADYPAIADVSNAAYPPDDTPVSAAQIEHHDRVAGGLVLSEQLLNRSHVVKGIQNENSISIICKIENLLKELDGLLVQIA